MFVAVIVLLTLINKWGLKCCWRVLFLFCNNDDDGILEVPWDLAKPSGASTDQTHGLGNGKLRAELCTDRLYIPRAVAA